MSRKKALKLFKGLFKAVGSFIQDADGQPFAGITLHFMTVDKHGVEDQVEMQWILAEITADALTEYFEKLKKETK